METKSKYDEVVELTNKLFVYTDMREWPKLVKEVFAESVLFDMSSLGAGEAKKISAREICQMWETGFTGIDHVHHQAGNFIVKFKNDDVEADIFCYAIAIHFKNAAKNGKTREFVGTYDLHASFTDQGWRLDAFRYNVKYTNGNINLD